MSGGPQVTGIVLAAGEGTRLGGGKQLLPFAGKTLLECVVDTALASSLQQLVVVLGHRAGELRSLLAGRDLLLVDNPRYRQGQSTSLQAGLQAVPTQSEAALFLLGDQPLLAPGTIDRLLAAYAATPSPIVLPVYAGRRGNPVLFSRETFPELSALRGDSGARTLFATYAGRLLRVPVNDPGILLDVDTREDYRRLHSLSRPPAADD